VVVGGVWKEEGVMGMPDGPVKGVVAGAAAAAVLAVGGVLLGALCLPMPMREGGLVACMVRLSSMRSCQQGEIRARDARGYSKVSAASQKLLSQLLSKLLSKWNRLFCTGV
jgi:hypothetical protein